MMVSWLLFICWPNRLSCYFVASGNSISQRFTASLKQAPQRICEFFFTCWNSRSICSWSHHPRFNILEHFTNGGPWSLTKQSWHMLVQQWGTFVRYNKVHMANPPLAISYTAWYNTHTIHHGFQLLCWNCPSIIQKVTKTISCHLIGNWNNLRSSWNSCSP